MFIKKAYLILLCLFISTQVWAQQKTFSTLLNKYVELTDNEEYDKALVVTVSMQKLALKSFGKNSWQYIRALNSTGYVYKGMRKTDSALLVLHKAYTQTTQFKGPNDTVKYRPLVNMAECYVMKGNKDSTVYYSTLAYESAKKGWGSNSEKFIINATDLANTLWDVDTTTAYTFYTSTLPSIEHVFGRKNRLVAENLLRIDDSIYHADKEYYNRFLGSRKERMLAIFQAPVAVSYSIDERNTYIKEFIISHDYYNAFYWGLTILYESLQHEKDSPGQVTQAAYLLGYLYEQHFQVKPFADYFYSSFFQTELSRSVRNFKEYDNPPEKYLGDRHFITDTSETKNDLQLVIPIGHTIQVNTLAFSPDKKYLISTSYDKSAKIWEISTGKLIVSLNHKTAVNSAAYSADGKYIITCPFPSDSSRSVNIWNSQGKLLKTLESDTTYFNNAVFSPDSKSILVACGDDMARLFDIESGKLIKVLPQGSTSYAEFSADGKYILTLGENGFAHLWNGINGKYMQRIEDGTDMKISIIHFSPSGKYFALSWSHKVQVFNTETQTLVSVMDYEHNNPQGRIEFTFSPDEREVLACAFTDSVKIFEVATGKLLRKFSTIEPASAVAYHPDNKSIVVGQDNLIVRDKQTGKIVKQFRGHTAYADEYDISPDGKHMVIPDREGRARIWEIATAKLCFVLSGHHEWIWTTKYSPDGKYIATCSFDSTARIWEATTGKLVSVFKGHKDKLRSIDFHPAGKIAITAADDNLAILWDIATGKMIDSVRLSKNKYNGYTANSNASVKFSTDGSLFVTSTVIDSVSKIWDTKSRKLISSLDGHKNTVCIFALSPDGRHILTTSIDSTARLWDLKTGKLIRKIVTKQSLYRACYSGDGTKVALTGEKSVELYNIATATMLHDLKGIESAWTTDFTADSKKLLTDGTDNLVSLWDVNSGKLIFQIDAKAGYMVSAKFSKDEKNIIGVCGDGTTKIWDTATGNLRYSFFSTDSADYFIQIPSGYYQSTQNAAKLLHYVTGDMKVVTFDQLDLKYNRPDKVQEGMGNTDTSLVKACRLAYYKRIRKMGVDTAQFSAGYSVPEADFKNRDAINYEQNKPTITLHITGRDSTYALDRFNVWVNASPVFGQRGISLKSYNRRTIDTVININLSDGENRIETSVTNVNGTESYRMPLQVKYEPSSPATEKLYFIGIGINRFDDSRYNLKWSVKDIRDLALHLKEKYKKDIVIDTLFDEDVSVKKITALKKSLQKAGVNDKVIVAYSGHGLLSKDYDYYLSTYKVDFPNPEKNGLPYDMLESLLDGIPARKKLMLIDACHSGEVDKEELKLTASVTKNNKKAEEGAKGFGDIKTVKGVGIKNSFELMQSLFANVGRSTGATVISAAAGTQFALERNELKNGVFTYSILEYMQTHPHATVTQLKQVVNRRVPELTKGAQVPTARVENDTVDWLVW